MSAPVAEMVSHRDRFSRLLLDPSEYLFASYPCAVNKIVLQWKKGPNGVDQRVEKKQIFPGKLLVGTRNLYFAPDSDLQPVAKISLVGARVNLIQQKKEELLGVESSYIVNIGRRSAPTGFRTDVIQSKEVVIFALHEVSVPQMVSFLTEIIGFATATETMTEVEAYMANKHGRIELLIAEYERTIESDTFVEAFISDQRKPIAEFRACLQTLEGKEPGVLMVTPTHVVFQPFVNLSAAGSVILPHSCISRLLPRTHAYRHCALEMFVLEGATVLPHTFHSTENFISSASPFASFDRIISFVLQDRKSRDQLLAILRSGTSVKLPNLRPEVSLQDVTDMWMNDGLSNAEYILELNFRAGRSFNDILSYPLFPWTVMMASSSKDDFRDFGSSLCAGDATDNGNREWPLHVHPAFICSMFSRTIPELEYSYTQLFPSFPSLESVPQLLLSLKSTKDEKGRTRDYRLRGLESCAEFFLGSGAFLVSTSAPKGVELPSWSRSPAEFVRSHLAILNCRQVSSALPAWINLAFGCEQKDAVFDADKNKVVNLRSLPCFEGSYDSEKAFTPYQEIVTFSTLLETGCLPDRIFDTLHPTMFFRKSSVHVGEKTPKNRSSLTSVSNIFDAGYQVSGNDSYSRDISKISNERDAAVERANVLSLNLSAVQGDRDAVVEKANLLSQALSNAERDFCTKEAELKNQIASLSSENAALIERLSVSQAQLAASIASRQAMENELGNDRLKFSNELERLQQQHVEQMETAEAQHAADVSSLNDLRSKSAATFEAEKAALMKRHAEDVALLHQQNADKTKEAEANWSAQLASLVDSHAAEKASIQQDHASLLEKLKASHAAELQSVKDDHMLQSQQLKDVHTSEIQNLRSSLSTDGSRVQSELEENRRSIVQLQAEVDEKKKTISDLSLKLVAIDSETARMKNEARVEKEETDRIILDLTNQKEDRDAKNSLLQTDLRSSQSKLLIFEEEVQRLKVEVQQLQEDLAKEKENTEKWQNAFDQAKAELEASNLETSRLRSENGDLAASVASARADISALSCRAVFLDAFTVCDVACLETDGTQTEEWERAIHDEKKQMEDNHQRQLAVLKSDHDSSLGALQQRVGHLEELSGNLENDLMLTTNARDAAIRDSRELESTRKQLQLDLDSKTAELSKVQDELCDARQSVLTVENELRSVRFENEKLAAAKHELETRAQSSQLDAQSLFHEISARDDRIRELEETLKKKEEELRQLTSEKTALDTQLVETRSKCSLDEDKIQGLSAENQRHLLTEKEKDGQISDLSGVLSQKNAELLALQSELETQRKRSQQSSVEHSSKIHQLEQSIRTLTQEKSDLQSRSDSEVRKCAEVSEKCQSLEKRNADVQLQMKDLENLLFKKDAELANCKDDVIARKKNEEKLSKSLEDAKKQVSALENERTSAASQEQSAVLKLKDMEAKLSASKARISAVEQDLQKLEDQQRELTKERDGAMRFKEAALLQKETAEKERTEAEGKCKRAEARIVEHSDMLKILKAQLEEVDRQKKANDEKLRVAERQIQKFEGYRATKEQEIAVFTERLEQERSKGRHMEQKIAILHSQLDAARCHNETMEKQAESASENSLDLGLLSHEDFRLLVSYVYVLLLQENPKFANRPQSANRLLYKSDRVSVVSSLDSEEGKGSPDVDEIAYVENGTDHEPSALEPQQPIQRSTSPTSKGERLSDWKDLEQAMHGGATSPGGMHFFSRHRDKMLGRLEKLESELSGKSRAIVQELMDIRIEEERLGDERSIVTKELAQAIKSQKTCKIRYAEIVESRRHLALNRSNLIRTLISYADSHKNLRFQNDRLRNAKVPLDISSQRAEVQVAQHVEQQMRLPPTSPQQKRSQSSRKP
eukprot:ANDGO_07561.mRNA.1 hypothetical protein